MSNVGKTDGAGPGQVGGPHVKTNLIIPGQCEPSQLILPDVYPKNQNVPNKPSFLPASCKPQGNDFFVQEIQDGPHGKPSEWFVAELNDALKLVPQKIAQKLFRENKIKIIAAPFLSDIFPGLHGAPRGYRKGTIINCSDGLYVPKEPFHILRFIKRSKNKIGIAEKRIISTDPPQVAANSEPGTALLHEVGHAYDVSKGDLSSHKAFIEAYKGDVADLYARQTPEVLKQIGYYLQTGKTGREETFAEIFARILASQTKPQPFLDYFPRTAENVRKEIEADVDQTKPNASAALAASAAGGAYHGLETILRLVPFLR